jgi:hypothetical protein
LLSKVVVLAYIKLAVCEGSFFPTSLPEFVVGGVLDDHHSHRSEVESRVVLICISFMARDGEHFFMCFLAIWLSSLETVLFSSVAHFFVGSLIWGEFSF